MIFGITGKTGSGKSFLIRNFAKNSNKSIYRIDVDKVGHQCLTIGDCKKEIINIFGDEILENNEINRSKLGEIVFSNKQLLEKLNQITHKYILEQIENKLEEFKSKKCDLIIIDAALLFEIGLDKECDKTILITSSDKERADKIIKRDNISYETAYNRLDKQTSDVLQSTRVDISIQNKYDKKSINNFIQKMNDMINSKDTNIYFTSDLHFDHEDIIEGCVRPFNNTKEMNEHIINNFNSIVRENDILYILGDVMFDHCDSNHIVELLSKINCKKRLIIGNHDKAEEIKSAFETVEFYKEIEYDGLKIIMSHYPIEEWNNKFFGSVHLHGHLHSSPKCKYKFFQLQEDDYNLKNKERLIKRFDVGIDANNFMPVSMKDIFEFSNYQDEKKILNFKDSIEKIIKIRR